MADTILETARLRLRTWDEADIEPFMAHLNTPTVTRWLDFDHPAFPQGHELCRHIVYGIDRPRNR